MNKRKKLQNSERVIFDFALFFLFFVFCFFCCFFRVFFFGFFIAFWGGFFFGGGHIACNSSAVSQSSIDHVKLSYQKHLKS